MNKVQLDLECKYELEESSVENPEFLKILEMTITILQDNLLYKSTKKVES
jgi:hypothetical protein